MSSKYTLHALNLAVCGVLLSACGGGGGGGSGQGNSAAENGKTEKEMVEVLSTRPDLVTDNDVLIALDLPVDVASSEYQVILNGKDITSLFNNSDKAALLQGLKQGDNQLNVSTAKHFQNLVLTNHSTDGSVLSGPQLNPWTCTNGSTDASCNKPVQYNYYYKDKVGLIQKYNTAKPPAAGLIATATTDAGVTVPFIIREEVGYQNRDEYRYAVLFDPSRPWTALQPQAQFNHKLVVTHGSSCGTDYQSGTSPTVIATSAAILPDITVTALGRGFAVMSTALSNSGHNCNLAVQAESLIMAKERFVEQYGKLRYTIGQGCSGGSLAAQWVANAYPGIYQGILPTCSFPDAWSTASQFADYHLMINYFSKPLQTGALWAEWEIAHVEGHVSQLNSYISELAQFEVARPDGVCNGISESQRYHPVNHPAGVRCSITDAAINMLAPRPEQIWSDNEKRLGRGFAGLPIDNVGVQYGLDSVMNGVISAEKFVLLNERLGGVNIDIKDVPQRLEANEGALRNAYRTGLINVANHLDKVAIIDCRGPDEGLFHDAYRAFAVRARLEKAHGNYNNHVIYGGILALVADPKCLEVSFSDMDRWLTQVEKDNSAVPLAAKLTRNKPADIKDSCMNGVGGIDRSKLCSTTLLPVHRTPRMVAGDSMTTYANKCQLKPLNISDYGNKVRFTDTQLQRLKAVFPDGVCDYTKAPVGFSQTEAWLSYQDRQGRVIYGGQPLPSVSSKSARGWASAAFQLF